MEPRIEPRSRLSAQLVLGLLIIAVGVIVHARQLRRRRWARVFPLLAGRTDRHRAGQAPAGAGRAGQARRHRSSLPRASGCCSNRSASSTSASGTCGRCCSCSSAPRWSGRGCAGGAAAAERSTDANSTISGVAVLGGGHRGNNSRSFRGGELTAVMGGCEIDLRQAAIEGEAVIDVFALWGGIEIRVPEDWTRRRAGHAGARRLRGQDAAAAAAPARSG